MRPTACRLTASPSRRCPAPPSTGCGSCCGPPADAGCSNHATVMATCLDNVGIAVRDIRQAMAFYTETLGLAGQAGESDGWVTLGDVSLYLFQTQAPEAAVPQRTTDL